MYHTFTRDAGTCLIVPVDLKDKFDGEIQRYNEYTESEGHIDHEVHEKSKPEINQKPQGIIAQQSRYVTIVNKNLYKLKILSQNVQGLKDKSKIEHIIDTMKERAIDIALI